MNTEHMAKLLEGVDAWNKWREENPDVMPDLGGAELSDARLIGANLRDANLRGANLDGAWLNNADLRGANLRGANLIDADLEDADLSGTNLIDANLCRTTFCGVSLDGARVNPKDIGGPGYILCALTDAEWAVVREGREKGGDREDLRAQLAKVTAERDAAEARASEYRRLGLEFAYICDGGEMAEKFRAYDAAQKGDDDAEH